MALKYNLYSSIEDIAGQVSSLEESISDGRIPEADLEVVAELDESLRHRVAFCASELTTGRRGGDEEKQLRNVYELYVHLLGARALDLASGLYDGGVDTGEIKRQVGILFEDTHMEIGSLDFEKRLQKKIERSKQLAAQHVLGRMAVASAASVAGSTAVLKVLESSSPMIQLSPEQQGSAVGISTVALVVGGFAIRSAIRNGPAQVGVALRGLVNGTYKEYLPPKREGVVAEEDMMELYAERRLERPLGNMAMELSGHQIESQADIAPMIGVSLLALKDAFYESYGMSPVEEKGPWYRQWIGWMLRADKTPESS